MEDRERVEGKVRIKDQFFLVIVSIPPQSTVPIGRQDWSGLRKKLSFGIESGELVLGGSDR